MKLSPPGKATVRLAAQSRFLMCRPQCKMLPCAYAHGDGWLVMEKLSSWQPPLEYAILALEEFWQGPSKGNTINVKHGWDMEVLKHAYDISPELASPLLRHLRSEDNVIVNTHGDPTLDNLMSSNGFPVFVDPLPPELHTPPFRALDIGKMLQSLWGWHMIEYGTNPHLKSRDFITGKMLNGLSPRERTSCWTFCVYHLIRALPYAKHRREVYELAVALTKEHLK